MSNQAAALSPLVVTLTADDVAHRGEFVRYVLEQAEPWHREHLGALYAAWGEFNTRYFSGALVVPYILLLEPSNPRRYGDCGPVSGFGGKSQIRIRPSLVDGAHPHVKAGPEFAEGRRRFALDILLHEMIHQWQMEITGEHEDAYHGHGPTFTARCNEIGATLGLPAVLVRRRGKGDSDKPVSPQWPHCVRPPDYYLGAFVPPGGDKPDRTTPELIAARMAPLVAQLDDAEFSRLIELLAAAREC